MLYRRSMLIYQVFKKLLKFYFEPFGEKFLRRVFSFAVNSGLISKKNNKNRLKTSQKKRKTSKRNSTTFFNKI